MQEKRAAEQVQDNLRVTVSMFFDRGFGNQGLVINGQISLDPQALAFFFRFIPEVEVGAVENRVGAEISDAEGREKVELLAVVVHSAEPVQKRQVSIILVFLRAHGGVHMPQILPHVGRDLINRHVEQSVVPSRTVVHAALPRMQSRHKPSAFGISCRLEPSVPRQNPGEKLLGFLER